MNPPAPRDEGSDRPFPQILAELFSYRTADYLHARLVHALERHQ